MAADPSQLLQTLIGTTGLSGGIMRQAQSDALAGQQAEQQLALGGQQQQLNQQQIAANDQAVQQEAAYHTDVSDWLAKGGDGAGLSKLVAKYPKQWQALQQSWKIKSDDQSRADLKSYGAVFNALDNGSPEVALSELQNRAAAEKAAGHDTTEINQHIDQIKAGDPKAIAAVKGWARAQIAAANPDAAKAVGVDLDSDRYKAISGKGVFDTRTGQYVADPTGGGDPASDGSGAAGGSGSPATGRTTGGWTPRQRNGGDNSDAAVDSKIAGVTKALGVSADSDLTGKNPMEIAQALTLSEGGPGSLADRNNNPANLRNGDGSYKKFPTKAAGLAAAAALVQRKLSQGLTTPRLMIEGKPIGGGAGASADAGGAGGALRGVGQYSAAAIDSMARMEKLPAGIPKEVRAAVINRKATLDAAKTDDSSTGADYLKTLSPGKQALLAKVNRGDADPPKPGSKFGEALAEDLARGYPGSSDTDFQARRRAKLDFTGNGKGAQNISALNRFYAHLNEAYEAHSKLAGLNIGPLSGAAATSQQGFDPKTVNTYMTALDGLQGEFQKLTKNGQGNESEAERIIHGARAAQSSDGRLGALQALASMAAAQVKPLHDQWRSAFNDGTPIPIDITPASRAVYQNIRAGGKHALPFDHEGAVAAPRSAVRTASGPNGQKLYLVGNRWQAHP